MPKVSWTVVVEKDGGTAFSAKTEAETAEGIDIVEVTLPANDTTEKEVDIQPGAAGDIQLLVVKSSAYSTDLTYKVSDGTSDYPTTTGITLDAPQVFTGGSVALFNSLDPIKLKFTNNSTTKSATVQVFVARDAMS